MISIISPAKTMNPEAPEMEIKLGFPQETAEILQLFPACLNPGKTYRAVDLYDGIAFKSLMRETWTQDDYDFANKKLYILSALYGAVRAGAGIEPYRLDFTKKGSRLYRIWGDSVTKLLCGLDGKILNLASDEFSKILKPHLEKYACQAEMLDVEFFEEVNGVYKKHSTLSKKARGLMAGWIVKNRIDSFEEIKGFNKLGYGYLEEKSQAHKFIFARRKNEKF